MQPNQALAGVFTVSSGRPALNGTTSTEGSEGDSDFEAVLEEQAAQDGALPKDGATPLIDTLTLAKTPIEQEGAESGESGQGSGPGLVPEAVKFAETPVEAPVVIARKAVPLDPVAAEKQGPLASVQLTVEGRRADVSAPITADLPAQRPLAATVLPSAETSQTSKAPQASVAGQVVQNPSGLDPRLQSVPSAPPLEKVAVPIARDGGATLVIRPTAGDSAAMIAEPVIGQRERPDSKVAAIPSQPLREEPVRGVAPTIADGRATPRAEGAVPIVDAPVRAAVTQPAGNTVVPVQDDGRVLPDAKGRGEVSDQVRTPMTAYATPVAAYGAPIAPPVAAPRATTGTTATDAQRFSMGATGAGASIDALLLGIEPIAGLDSFNASAEWSTSSGQSDLRTGFNALIRPGGEAPLPRFLASQLADAARGMSDRALELVLEPAELGRVRMTLAAGDGTMMVNLMIERAETADLLRRNIETLAQEFRNLGYDDVQFDFGQSGTQQGDTSAEEGFARGEGEHSGLSPATSTQTAAPPLRVHLSDGMDLRL